MSYLLRLNKAFEKLAEAKNLDDLFRRAVLAAREDLGFDRAGILLFDNATQEQVGTWGTDARGRLRKEHDFRAPLTPDLITKTTQDRVKLTQDKKLKELGEEIDSGWHVQAAIFSSGELFGWLFIDNLVKRESITEEQFEVIKSYSNVLGQLIVRSKIEDTLLMALDSLATNEDLKMDALERVQRLESQIAGNQKLVQLAERLSGLVPMSARAVGNLLNFISLLTPEQFSETDRGLLTSAQKSAQQLSRIYRHFDQKVHEATDDDVQSMPAAVIQDYWTNQFKGLFRNTPHHLEVRTDNPTQEVSMPLILLTQLVKELINNALQHGLENSESGRTIVSLKTSDKAMTVSVEDSGCGLDDDQYGDVLKLFVTSKPNEYLGSGLNVTQYYVERWLNGQLDLMPSKLGGLCCRLHIPIAPAKPVAES